MRLELDAKSYAGRTVLGRLTLDVTKGQRIAVLGPSGIGKSTLLRIVAGLDDDFDGNLTGTDRSAVVFQEPTLLPWRRAIRNLTIPTRCSVGTARDLMVQVGLGGSEDLFPRQMSLGQRRRLALARAFAARPDVLLMDEPFASLDPDTAARMIDLTAGLLDRSGAGLILVTHDASEPVRLGAQVRHLSGQPAQFGPD